MSSTALPAPAERETLLFRSALILDGGIFLVLLVAWLRVAAAGGLWRADFTAMYTGWAMVLDGHGARLYDLGLQETYQQRALPDPALYRGLLPHAWPPHSSFLFAPLALLSRGAAYWVWACLQAGLCLLAWRQVRWLTRAWEPRARGVVLFACLGFPPLVMSFQQGQTALLSLVCLLGFVRGLKEGKPWPTALWLVLGSIKPQLTLIPAAILLGGRRWRELAIAAGALALWAGLAGLVLGWEAWWSYPRYLHFSSQQFNRFGIDPHYMYNVKGLLTALLGEDRGALINALTSAVLLLAVVVVLWLWRGPWRPEAPAFDLRLSATLLLAAVSNPHLHATDLLLLVPAALLLVEYRRRCEMSPGALAAVLLCPLLLMIDTGVHPWPGHVRPFILLMLAATAWLAWGAVRQRVEAAC
jgi:hypothetical protein